MLLALEQKFLQLQFTRKQQQAFLEDFCSLIEDGVSVKQAIDVLSRVTRGATKLVAQSISENMANGKSIADGMEGWFSRACIEVIRVGETTGSLAKTLRAAIYSFSQQNDAVKILLQSMVYPVIVFIMAATVVVFVKHTVLDGFSHIKSVMFWPWVGRLVFNLGNVIQHEWWLFLLAFLALTLLVKRTLYYSTGSIRLFMDKLPLLSLYRDVLAAELMENLGMLLSNGMVMKQALTILQRDATPYLQWHLLLMEHRLSGGKENIADVLDTHLIRDDDMIRLKTVAEGKGFTSALTSLGRKANARCARMIALTGRITGGILLFLGAMTAALMVFAIYTIGSVIAI